MAGKAACLSNSACSLVTYLQIEIDWLIMKYLVLSFWKKRVEGKGLASID